MSDALEFVRNSGVAGEEVADRVDSLEKENAQLRKDVKMLRDSVLSVCCDPEGIVCIRGSDGDRQVLQEALAATEDKP